MVDWTAFSLWLSNHLEVFAGVFLVGIGFFSVRSRTQKQRGSKELYEKTVSESLHLPTSLHPEVNALLCVGCGTCTRACPEGDVLQLINHLSTLIAPTQCVGHGECEQACPQGAIRLVFGTKTRGMNIPRITKDYETNVPGLYIAGELGGMGLIRNAVKQGALAAEHALSGTERNHEFDLLIVGAGPAGFSAALKAVELKKRYLCIEQNSFGGTIYNFPRQKIVMTAPLMIPMMGQVKFKSNKVSKEELLEQWCDIRSRFGVEIQEGSRFLELTKIATGGFSVRTTQGTFSSAKVLLSMGVRGTPRKLGLMNEDLPKVTYALLDADQYVGRDVAVVGGGNSAVEAAQALAQADLKNRVKLFVKGATFDRCNDENRKIIQDLAKAGRLKIYYKATVTEIHEDHLQVSTDAGVAQSVPNDFLFIFAGTEMPHGFLMGLGIQIEKKFGEGLSGS